MIQFGVLFVWQKGRLQNLPSVLSKLSKAKLSLHLFGEQPSHPETVVASPAQLCAAAGSHRLWRKQSKKMKTKLE